MVQIYGISICNPFKYFNSVLHHTGSRIRITEPIHYFSLAERYLRGIGALPRQQEESLTFIISTTVLRAIKVMMAYSNGGDTTNFHILYWKDCLFSGMYLVSGLALMAKSIQALCLMKRQNKNKMNPR